MKFYLIIYFYKKNKMYIAIYNFILNKNNKIKHILNFIFFRSISKYYTSIIIIWWRWRWRHSSLLNLDIFIN